MEEKRFLILSKRNIISIIEKLFLLYLMTQKTWSIIPDRINIMAHNKSFSISLLLKLEKTFSAFNNILFIIIVRAPDLHQSSVDTIIVYIRFIFCVGHF